MFICTAVVSPDCGVGQEDLKPCLSWIWKSDNVILIKWPARHWAVCLYFGACWWFWLMQPPTDRFQSNGYSTFSVSRHGGNRGIGESVIFSLHKCKTHKKKHFLQYCFNRATWFGLWRLRPQQSAVYSISLRCLSDHTCQTQSHMALGTLGLFFSLGGIFYRLQDDAEPSLPAPTVALRKVTQHPSRVFILHAITCKYQLWKHRSPSTFQTNPSPPPSCCIQVDIWPVISRLSRRPVAT